MTERRAFHDDPPVPRAWRCSECCCGSYALVSERKPDGAFRPGPLIRCVECKSVFDTRTAMTRPVTPITTERGDAEGFVQIPASMSEQAHQHSVDLAQCALFVDAEAPAKAMTDASVFLHQVSLFRASPPASVTGTEGDHRELRAVMRQLSAAKNAGGIEGAETQAQVLGYAVDTCIGQIREFLAASSHPGEADRVGLGELAARFEAKREECEMKAREVWNDLLALGWKNRANAFADARDMARAGAASAVPASLAALGTGEGSGGASPMGTGLPSIAHAPADHGPAGGYPSRDEAASLWIETCRKFITYSFSGNRPSTVRLADDEDQIVFGPAPDDDCERFIHLAAADAVLARVSNERPKAEDPKWLSPTGRQCDGEAGTPQPLPHPQAPNTLSEVEEARALLEKEKRAYNGNPSEIVKYLRWRSDLVGDEPETRLDLLSRADAIEAALAALASTEPHASSEEASR